MLLILAAPRPIVVDAAELSRWEDDGGSCHWLAADADRPTRTAAGTSDRDASIEQMMGKYRAAKQRRQVARAVKLWEEAEADQQLAEFEAPEEQVH